MKILSACLVSLVFITHSFSQKEGIGEENAVPWVTEGMVLIPGGEFEMGIVEADLGEIYEMGKGISNMTFDHVKWWYGDELPQHTVKVDSFYMDIYEVTNAQFREFVKASGREAEGNCEKYAGKGRDNHPVVCVSWNDASEYAKWAGKRLPTEEEWEYAAIGGRDVKWFTWWGDEPYDHKANYNYEGESFGGALWWMIFGRKIGTEPVGSYEPNGYGLYDMIGNIGEWCANQRKPYPGWDKQDWVFWNRGPFIRDNEPFYGRALRGGSWTSCDPIYIRLKNRTGLTEAGYKFDRGFRCVKSVE